MNGKNTLTEESKVAEPTIWFARNVVYMFILFFLFPLLFVATLFTYKAFTLGPVGNDAGYYLSVAARISEGWIPFKDLYLEYPPVGFYFYSLVAYLSSGFKIENYYFVTYLFIIGTSVLVYFIGLALFFNKLLALLGSLFNLALTLYCQGYLSLLEPFTVFFYLAAILLVFKGMRHNSSFSFFLAGIFVFLSFFSKQYGLIVLPAIFVYVLMSTYSLRRKVNINLIMFAGFCFCGGVAILYYVAKGVSVYDIVTSLSGRGDGSSSYGIRSVSVMLKAILSYILRSELFFLIVPALLLLDRRFRKDKKVIFLVILNLCAFLPLYFKSFTHYYQLIVPFSVLLGIYILHYGLEICRSSKLSILSVSSVAFSMILMLALISKVALQFEHTYYKYSKKDEHDIAAELLKAVPSGSQVFMIGVEEMYAINNYLPVEPKKLGYMFQGWLTPEGHVSLVKPGQYLIIPAYNLEEYKPLLREFTQIPAGERVFVFRR